MIEGVHKGEPIKRIQYIPHNDLIITGSASPRTSVVINDRKGNRKPYVFKLLKVRLGIGYVFKRSDRNFKTSALAFS